MKIEVTKADANETRELAEGIVQKSAARERLEKLRASRGGLIEARTIEGEEWFIKRLSWPEITRVKLAIPRDAQGVLNLSKEDHLRGVTAAMLATAVATSAEDATPYFTNAEAVEWVDEPSAIGLVSALFNAVCEVNPDVLPNSPAAPSKQ